MDTPSPTPRGRPRSERSKRAILDAAYQSLVEDGYVKCSIEGIASRAMVSKATIYRWWPRKSALILDALTEIAEQVNVFQDTGDVRADVEKELRGVIEFYSGGRPGQAVLELLGASSLDADLAKDLVDRIIDPAIAAAKARLEVGLAAGQLAEGTDCELLVHLLGGAIFHCYLVAHRPVAPSFATQICDSVFAAYAPRPAPCDVHDADE